MWEDHLKADGFAVVRNVLSLVDCIRLRRQALDELDVLPNMNHSDTLWRIRTLPQVRRLFENLWKTTDLIAGFDGITARRRGSSEYLAIDWHIDQNHTHEPGRRCVQAFVALTDSTPESGTIQFVRGSHGAHEDLVWRLCQPEEAELDGTEGVWEFVPIPPSDPVLQGEVVCPVVRAGDVVLWDARTAHRVCQPTGDAPRLVAYVCHVPRSFADAVTLKQRRQFFEQAIATTHWPHRLVDRGDVRGVAQTLSDAPSAVRALV